MTYNQTSAGGNITGRLKYEFDSGTQNEWEHIVWINTNIKDDIIIIKIKIYIWGVKGQ